MTDIAEMDNVERVGAELDSHRIEFLVVKKTSHHKFVAILLDGALSVFRLSYRQTSIMNSMRGFLSMGK